MESIKTYKARLDQLHEMLQKIKAPHAKVTQLRRSVSVLRVLLKDETSIRSPYGPTTPIVPFSIQ
jgi:predicted translin family RNA/ssDNA-binding protein